MQLVAHSIIFIIILVMVILINTCKIIKREELFASHWEYEVRKKMEDSLEDSRTKSQAEKERVPSVSLA